MFIDVDMPRPAHTALLLAASKHLRAHPSATLAEALSATKPHRIVLQAAVNACEATRPGSLDLRGAAAAAVAKLASVPGGAPVATGAGDSLEAAASLDSEEEDARAQAFAADVLEGRATAEGARGFAGLARALEASLRARSVDLAEVTALRLALSDCLTAWREAEGCAVWATADFSRPGVKACAAAQERASALWCRVLDLVAARGPAKASTATARPRVAAKVG